MARSADTWVTSPWFLTMPPQVAQGIVARRRLVSRLAASVDSASIVLIAAPSGYGKTVTLTAFADEAAHPPAWLTLTRHEKDDEELILAGILSAVERLRSLPSTHASGRPAGEPTSGAEIRELYGRIAQRVAEVPEGIVIILDDAHHAGGVLGEIVDVLTNLTRERLRFAIAGKPAMLTWFAKQRALSPRIVIDARELAMSVDEVKDAAAAHGVVLDDAAAESSRRATGGWPIALQLLDLGSAATSAEWVGQETLFVDFLEGNVLPKLSPRMHDFILATTTCNRLDATLARALSGQSDADALLEECIASGMSLERFTDEAGRIVYRWHDAFAEACRRIVMRTSGARSRELHAIAARRLAVPFPTEALLHAAQTDDAELTLSIIRSSWIRIMLESGARVLQNSCLSLPAAQGEQPEVLAIRACCLNMTGDINGAQMLAARAVLLGSADPEFSATYTFARLFLVDDHASLSQAAEDAQTFLSSGESDSSMHAYRVFLLGWTELRLRRDPAAAPRLLRTAMNEARATHRVMLEKRAASNLFFALIFAGNFTEADQLIAESLDVDDMQGDWGRYDGGIGLFAFGFGAYWRGRLDEAETALRLLVERGGHEGSYAALGRVYLILIATAKKNPRETLAAQAYADGIGSIESHGLPWPVYRAYARALLLLAHGHVPQGLEAIASLVTAPNVPVVRVTLAETARQAGDPMLAMRLLGELSPAERSISYIAVAAEVTRALIFHERNDSRRAHGCIERAVGIAAREDVLQPFRVPDPRLRELLSAHAVSGSTHGDFIATRLSELEATANSGVGDALSDREREVLGYLRTSMTANEIAAALFVSVSTVRTHLRAIYRKLGVTNRREAVKLRR